MKPFSDLPGDSSSEAIKRFLSFVGFLIFATIVLVGISFAMGQAKQDDLSQGTTLHKSCVVNDKEFIANRAGRDYSTYKVKTSCGEFVTDSTLYETVVQNETYDFTATVGNWANKPTILTAEVVSK